MTTKVYRPEDVVLTCNGKRVEGFFALAVDAHPPMREWHTYEWDERDGVGRFYTAGADGERTCRSVVQRRWWTPPDRRRGSTVDGFDTDTDDEPSRGRSW